MNKLIPTTLLLALAVLVLPAAPLSAGEAEMDDTVTLTGELMCAKCTLKLEGFEECQDVLVVEEDGEESHYFVAADEHSAKVKHACTEVRDVKMKGTLAEKDDGRTWITPIEVEELGG